MIHFQQRDISCLPITRRIIDVMNVDNKAYLGHKKYLEDVVSSDMIDSNEFREQIPYKLEMSFIVDVIKNVGVDQVQKCATMDNPDLDQLLIREFQIIIDTYEYRKERKVMITDHIFFLIIPMLTLVPCATLYASPNLGKKAKSAILASMISSLVPIGGSMTSAVVQNWRIHIHRPRNMFSSVFQTIFLVSTWGSMAMLFCTLLLSMDEQI